MGWENLLTPHFLPSKVRTFFQICKYYIPKFQHFTQIFNHLSAPK